MTMFSQGFMECSTLHNMLANLCKSFGQQRLVCLLINGVEGIIQCQASAQKGRHLTGRRGKLTDREFAWHPEPERQLANPLRPGFPQISQVDALVAQLLGHHLAPGTVNGTGFFASLIIET